MNQYKTKGREHMRKGMTPFDKLRRRISREYEKKKLIGDIAINDEEYKLLLTHLSSRLKYAIVNGKEYLKDPLLTVALVQIGIRNYCDGSYWEHVQRELGLSHHLQQAAKILGDSFSHTLTSYEKIRMDVDGSVRNILMHCFVTNHYADAFFDFLYAFYEIDLQRNINAVDRNTMNELIQTMMLKDNTGRTYHLIRSTSNAIELHTRGAKTRIRRYLKLIDKAFWNEELPIHSQTRLTQLFIKWTETSEKLNQSKAVAFKNGMHGNKFYSSPYLHFNAKNESYILKIPPQMIRFQAYEALFWEVQYNGQITKYPINPTLQGVTGYKTDDVFLSMTAPNILQEIKIVLKNNSTILHSFRISSAPIRFFDADGDQIKQEALPIGNAFSISDKNTIPESEAILDLYDEDGLYFAAYEFVKGDMIRFQQYPPIAIGNKIQDGLLPRGRIPNMFVPLDNNISIPVYSERPTVFFTLHEKQLEGTAFYLNDICYRLQINGKLADGIEIFPMQNGTEQLGVIVSLQFLAEPISKLYEIRVDIPNRHAILQWQCMVLHNFSYHFAESPYIFRTHGTLCVPNDFLLEPLSKDVQITRSNENEYNFPIPADESYLTLFYQGTPLSFEIPVLRYRFEGEAWQISPHIDFWHSEFQPIVDIQYPASRMTFQLDEKYEDSENDETHIDSFQKNASQNLFHCDLNRFRSWFGRTAARRQILLCLPDIPKPIPFVGVVTKSILHSGELTADIEKKRLIGKFTIIGKSMYYADLYCEEICISEKIPLTDGMLVAELPKRFGTYQVEIFESEEDDSGFGDIAYYSIGKRELEIVDPNDMSGKSIRIQHIFPKTEPNSFLRLYYKYLVVNLQKAEESETAKYIGKMIVKTTANTIKATFPVCVAFESIDNLRNAYIAFLDEDGDETEFLYDEVITAIVKQEDKRLSKSEKYRRYQTSLFSDEYVYEVEFVIATQFEQVCCVDDTLYNNLYIPPKVSSSLKKKEPPIPDYSIEKLALPPWLQRAFMRSGINTTTAIAKKSKAQLLAMRNMTEAEFEEICRNMSAFGWEYDEMKMKFVFHFPK